MDQHRNPLIWRRNQDWEWVLKEDIIANISDTELDNIPTIEEAYSKIEFILTESKESSDKKDEYILFGKGM
jgi:hypothetical protein